MSVYGRYGTDPAPATEGSSSSYNLLQTLAPAAAAVISDLQDPYKQAELLRVKIARAKASGMPSWRIAQLEAKLRAAERQLNIEQADTSSTQEWSTLGKVGVVVGIVGGVSLTLLLLSAATRLRRV